MYTEEQLERLTEELMEFIKFSLKSEKLHKRIGGHINHIKGDDGKNLIEICVSEHTNMKPKISLGHFNIHSFEKKLVTVEPSSGLFGASCKQEWRDVGSYKYLGCFICFMDLEIPLDVEKYDEYEQMYQEHHRMYKTEEVIAALKKMKECI